MRTCLRKTGLVATTATVVAALCLGTAALRAEPAAVKAVDAAGSFLIPAYAFDRGNAKTFTQEWADAEPMIAFGGASPVVVEYDIDFPVAATYTIHVRYAAQEPRPVELSLDDKSLGQCCRTATGTWNTSGAQVGGVAARVAIAAGKHTLKLRRDGGFPHVVSLRFDSSVPLCRRTGSSIAPRRESSTVPRPFRAESGTPIHRRQDRRPCAWPSRTSSTRSGRDIPAGRTFCKRLDALQGESERLEREARQIRRPRSPAQGVDRRPGRPPPRGPAGQSAAGLRQAAAGQAGRQVARASACRRTGRATRSLPKTGFDDEIAVLSPVRPDGAADDALQARRRPVRGRRGPALRRRPDALLDARRQRPLAGLRDRRRRHGPAAADRRAARRRQLRRLLPARRPDPVHLDGLFRRRAVRVRQLARGQCSTSWTPTAGTSASSASTRSTTGARRC